MKRIAWLTLIGMLLLVGAASAAYIEIDAPSSVYVGEPLVVTGTTILEGLSKPTIEPGFSTDIVFYRAVYTKQEVGRKTIVVQQDGTFSATFPTKDLKAGQYTVEIVDPTTTTFGGSSTTLQFVTLIDRSADLIINAPLTQDFDGGLDITGSVSGLGNSGIEIRVIRASETVFGPEYIQTDANGAFSTSVPIMQGGSYQVVFSDTKGYIGTADFSVTGGPSTPSTTTPTPTATPPVISATAPSSRSSPAYFAVDTQTGLVTLSTTPGIDWVIEYIDENGNLDKVNSKGMNDPEVAEVSAQGGTIYVKVYPMSYNDSGTVRLSATGADAIQVSQTAPVVFGDATPTSTPAAPLPAIVVVIALLVFIGFRRR
jgi:hypothetical protein